MEKDIVHEMYMEALRDERAILKRAIAEGDNIAELAREMLDNCKRTLARGWSGDMAHYMRGSRDFWANQVKIHPIG
jgi:hypothetical protein